MAYQVKQYSGDAAPTTLAANIGAADASFTAVNGANYPDGSIGPFVVDLNLNNTFIGGGTEEKILCSSRSGNVFTVATSGRGYDGTTATAHVAGEPLNHTITAVDMQEANTAVVNTVGRISALGDMLIGSAANALARLGIGSNGNVLTVVGGTAAWATATQSIYLGSAKVNGATLTNGATYSDLSSGALAVTATVPASGRIRITVGTQVQLFPTAANPDANAMAGIFGTGTNIGNTPAGSLGVVAGDPTPQADFNIGSPSGGWTGLVPASFNTFTAVWLITGLTPGSTTFTVKWANTNAGTAVTSIGSGSTHPTGLLVEAA